MMDIADLPPFSPFFRHDSKESDPVPAPSVSAQEREVPPLVVSYTGYFGFPPCCTSEDRIIWCWGHGHAS